MDWPRTPIGNGSDDRLLANFVDPANGCTAFSATDPTDAAGASGSQALNELSARVNQTGTIAVVPVNDEMTLVNSAYSIAKTNVYRSLVDQPLLAGNVDPNAVAADYCQNMVNIAPAHNQVDLTRDTAFASPVPATGTNLASFLGARLAASFGVLGCAKFGVTDPVNATVNGAGAATAVTYNLAQQKAAITAADRRRRRHADSIADRCGRRRVAVVRRAASPLSAPPERNRNVGPRWTGPPVG